MPHYDIRLTRLFVTADLAEDCAFSADDAQASYLIRVLRKKEGDVVLLFNGRDGEWEAILQGVGKRTCELRPTRQVREQTYASNLVCCFAPLKKARMDYMVQKAVEMGAGQLRPIMTDFTQVDRVKTERMQANVIEAAQQCGVLSVPTVTEPILLSELLADWPDDQALVFCDERVDGADAYSTLRASGFSSFGLLVGPEGGFSDDERNILRVLPNVVTISLGPRILRADTALVAALAVMQSAVGDWRI